MLATLKPFLAGAILMGCWAVALFFFRFFKQTRDRLFIWFAMAFFLLGAERLLIFLNPSPDAGWSVYLVRLLAFLLIAFGIINKNRAKTRPNRQRFSSNRSTKSAALKHHDNSV
jgi:hypothetical protein